MRTSLPADTHAAYTVFPWQRRRLHTPRTKSRRAARTFSTPASTTLQCHLCHYYHHYHTTYPILPITPLPPHTLRLPGLLPSTWAPRCAAYALLLHTAHHTHTTTTHTHTSFLVLFICTFHTQKDCADAAWRISRSHTFGLALRCARATP